jgi:hypothetical protein
VKGVTPMATNNNRWLSGVVGIVLLGFLGLL